MCIRDRHLYSRATFGISYPNLKSLSKKTNLKVVDELFKNAEKFDDLKSVDENEVRQQMALLVSLGARKEFTPEEKEKRQEITRSLNERSRTLNICLLYTSRCV